MPINITLPLSPALQAVADARENVRKLGYKVEELKTSLKSAKGAWEEAVEDLNARLDEMIDAERSPSLFDGIGDDKAGGESDGPKNPTPPAPAGQPVAEVVEVDPVVTYRTNDFAQLPAATADTTGTDKSDWRNTPVAESLDGPAWLFDTLDLFGVTTMGQLADALQRGETFNQPLLKVSELWEVIELASADDEVPVKFGREAGEVAITVKEQAGDPAGQPNGTYSLNDLAAAQGEPAVEVEPAKPAKKPRGKKAKAVEPEPAAVADEQREPSIDDL